MNKENIYAWSLLAMLLILVSISVAVRPLSIGTDSYAYALTYTINTLGYYNGNAELAYKLLMDIIGIFTEDYRIFFFATSLILLILSIIALLKVARIENKEPLKESYAILIISSILFISPFFFSLQVNILRQGLATPLIIIGFLYLYNQKPIFAIMSFITSIGLHHSSIMYIAVAPIIFLQSRNIIIIIAALSLLYLSGLTQEVLGPIMSIIGLENTLTEITEYGANSEYRAGIRFDLWAFTVCAIAATLLIQQKIKTHGLAAKIMMASFIPFLIFGNMAYSDRFLVLCWFMIPLMPAIFSLHLIKKISSGQSSYATHVLLAMSFIFITVRLEFYS